MGGVTRKIVKTLKLLQESKGKLELSPNLPICISFGEPALHPDLEEIISVFPDAFYQILTNASVYSSVIEDAIKKNGEIVMSLDSGTAETFRKIKGVNCFDTVRKNLIKYRKFGSVIPKFIILEGINDTQEDIDGFVEICKELSPQRVEIVRDYLVDGFEYNRFNYSDQTMRIVARLFNKLEALGFNVNAVVFPEYYSEVLRSYL